MGWNDLTPREMDALVAKHVMGYEFVKPTHGACCTCQNCGKAYEDCLGCEYSTIREHVLAVEEEIERRGWECSNRYSLALYELVSWTLPTNPYWALIRAAPHLRCHAALMAVGVDV